MQDFVSDFSLESFEHLIDADRSLWQVFEVRSQPAFAFINQNGEISVHNGRLGEEDLIEELELLLAS